VYGNNQLQAAGGAAALAAPGANTTVAGTMIVNGTLGSATITVDVNSTAKANTDKINLAASVTGVVATARTELSLTFAAAGAYNLTLQSDNVAPQAVAFTIASATTTEGLASAVTAINDQSSKTGITASLNSTGTAVVLTNATGNDISVADTTVPNAGDIAVQKLGSDGSASGAPVTLTADATAATSTVVGYITLDSDKSFAIDVTTTNLAVDGGSTLNKVSDLDVTTFAKATQALKTVDSALGFINGERARLGALQSRFETSIANLQVTSENLSASRSRILDADFAQETANLARAQILQQAGTAMVAQANQLPQQVLALLQN
ncbi:MAG: flagellin, partial [Rhodoferax sp.]|nr:flagellin [Rhodoferax sp.]